jgi:OOP family OmpA-OmpF porin
LGVSSASAKSVTLAPEAVQPSTVKTITINLNVEFEFDKATVMSIYSDQLATVAKAMQEQADIELVLEGHTDSLGSESYNNDLSARRAEAVKQKLATDYSISASRISTVGYGESQPIASNETAEGRALNRRVVGEMSFTEVIVD